MSARRLLIDVGNSRLKWALLDDTGRTPATAISHHGAPAETIASIDAVAVDRIVVANVTGAAHAEALRAALVARFGRVPEFAQPVDGLLGLRIAYAEPTRLGVDRWLGLLAAWAERGTAACVASAGTALTFDAVDAAGQHLGGIIAPGLLTAQQAVLGATRFAAAGPAHVYGEHLGTDTEACVRQGALHACAGLVERLATRHGGERRYLTGGDAAVLRPFLDGDWTVAGDLVIAGLARLASR